MESDLKILEVETVEPLAPVAETRQRYSCDLGCSDTHEDSLQYIKHLAEHEQKVQESYQRMKTRLDSLDSVNSADFVCSSCSETVLHEKEAMCKTSLGNLLELHRTQCRERIVKARDSLYSPSESSGAVGAIEETGLISRRDTELDVSQKIYDKPGHRCEDCIVLQGEKSICSRNLNVSLSDLNTSKSVLDFLDKNKWRNCPYCLAPVPTETLPVHLILSHGDVYDIVGKIYSTIL